MTNSKINENKNKSIQEITREKFINEKTRQGDFNVFKTNVITGHYFCIDIETTGLEPNKDEGILEIYFKEMKDDKIINEFYKTYYHPRWINTAYLHKINATEIMNRPRFIECDENKKLIKNYFMRCADPFDDIVFMAQYAPFEHKWFREFLDLDESEKVWFDKVKTCDTRHLAKQLFPDKPHNLISLCEQFKIKFPEGQHDFHRADQDVNAMYEVYKNLIKVMKERGIEPSKYEAEKYQFNFNESHGSGPISDNCDDNTGFPIDNNRKENEDMNTENNDSNRFDNLENVDSTTIYRNTDPCPHIKHKGIVGFGLGLFAGLLFADHMIEKYFKK